MTAIAIDALHTHAEGDTVAAELRITVDASEELYVVDVIQFNSEGPI